VFTGGAVDRVGVATGDGLVVGAFVAGVDTGAGVDAVVSGVTAGGVPIGVGAGVTAGAGVGVVDASLVVSVAGFRDHGPTWKAAPTPMPSSTRSARAPPATTAGLSPRRVGTIAAADAADGGVAATGGTGGTAAAVAVAAAVTRGAVAAGGGNGGVPIAVAAGFAGPD
jgi:hypothetical protein